MNITNTTHGSTQLSSILTGCRKFVPAYDLNLTYLLRPISMKQSPGGKLAAEKAVKSTLHYKYLLIQSESAICSSVKTTNNL